jgi:hypothetical protein
MWMMARSSLPAYLMFIIYTQQTVSFVPPSVPQSLSFALEAHQPQKENKKKKIKS